MKTSEQIEQAIRDLEVQTDAKTDTRILADAKAALLSAASGAGTVRPAPVPRKRMLKHPWGMLGTAAAALLGMVCSLYYISTNHRPSISSEDTETILMDDRGVEMIPTPISTPVTVPLQIDLPDKVTFGGTQKPVRVAPLEPYVEGNRPPFLVPLDVYNVAFGKTVTSSDPAPMIGKLDMMTDGDREGHHGSWVELGPGTQWVQIDLEQEYTIYAILVWHYFADSRAFHDVIVQTADDPDFTRGVRTLFNNDRDNSSGQGIGRDWYFLDTYEGKLIDAKGINARYVRLYSNGNTSDDINFYIEVEVYGIDE